MAATHPHATLARCPPTKETAMNTANLQLEGLYMALAVMIELLKDKGLVSAAEVDTALGRAESAAGEGKDLSPSNLEAIGFPIRLLRLANETSFAGHPLPFNELARRIGEAKDQRTSLSEEEYLRFASTIEHERDA
jgi:hypothetical protein